MRFVVSGRGRFKIGWGLAWAAAALAVQFLVRDDSGNTSTTVVADAAAPLLSDAARTLLLFAGCALAPALGSFIAASGTGIAAAARWRIAVVWAVVGLATAAANVYLASHPGPDWWYESVTRYVRDGHVRTRTAHPNPWTVHLAMTLPLAGALGGLYQCLETTVAAGMRRLAHALAWVTLWAATFLLARYFAVIAVYLFYGATVDLFEAAGWSILAGTVTGTFVGGYLTGHVLGAILSHSPGIVWAPDPGT